MSDGATFAISGVRYDVGRRLIQLVRVHVEPSHFLLGEYPRDQVIASASRGDRWITIVQDGVDWRRGAEVRVVEVDGRRYLRTDRDEVEEDDLGELAGL